MTKDKSEQSHTINSGFSSASPNDEPTGVQKLLNKFQQELEREERLKASGICPDLSTRQNSITLDELETFPEFHRKRPNISQNQLEWIYRHRKHNGFAKAFKKIGKLRYVIVPVFTALLLSNEGDG